MNKLDQNKENQPGIRVVFWRKLETFRLAVHLNFENNYAYMQKTIQHKIQQQIFTWEEQAEEERVDEGVFVP